jgi:hypothetical protein
VKRRWALAAIGAGVGGLAALAYALATAPRERPSPRLAEDTPRVAAWLDARLLAAAAAAVSARPDEAQEMDSGVETPALQQQREHLYHVLDTELRLDPKLIDAIALILGQSPHAGTGNPECTSHPLSRDQCLTRRAQLQPLPSDAALCGAPNMVAIFNPRTEDVNHARVCMDQFEFPNVPCEYPLVWVRASEAAAICKVVGKRLCDAHEWEGACAGALLPVEQEYFFEMSRDESALMHNERRVHSWLGSLTPLLDVCATMGAKSPNCWDVTWEACGSNTYPTGSFPGCVSPFGVYDLLGNVAEHMNLPLRADQLASKGGIGETEMKGSWFAHDGLAPHPDDCRWRAPAWHETLIDSPHSHRNYQLGFRCCKDI